jgi:hypothetical protein
VIGKLPSHIGDVVVVGGVDAETVVPLVCAQVQQPIAAIGPDFKPHNLGAVFLPRSQVGSVGSQIREF